MLLMHNMYLIKSNIKIVLLLIVNNLRIKVNDILILQNKNFQKYFDILNFQELQFYWKYQRYSKFKIKIVFY